MPEQLDPLTDVLEAAEAIVRREVQRAFASLADDSSGDAVARAKDLAALVDARRAAEAAHQHRVKMDGLRFRMAVTAHAVLVTMTAAALTVVVVTSVRGDYRAAGVATLLGLPHLIALYLWNWRWVVRGSSDDDARSPVEERRPLYAQPAATARVRGRSGRGRARSSTR